MPVGNLARSWPRGLSLARNFGRQPCPRMGQAQHDRPVATGHLDRLHSTNSTPGGPAQAARAHQSRRRLDVRRQKADPVPAVGNFPPCEVSRLPNCRRGAVVRGARGKSMPCAAHSASTPRMTDSWRSCANSRRAPWAEPCPHVILLIGRGRRGIGRARVPPDACSRSSPPQSSPRRSCSPVQPGIRGKKRRQIVAERRVATISAHAPPGRWRSPISARSSAMNVSRAKATPARAWNCRARDRKSIPAPHHTADFGLRHSPPRRHPASSAAKRQPGQPRRPATCGRQRMPIGILHPRVAFAVAFPDHRPFHEPPPHWAPATSIWPR